MRIDDVVVGRKIVFQNEKEKEREEKEIVEHGGDQGGNTEGT